MKSLLAALVLGFGVFSNPAGSSENGIALVYEVRPIGWVRKSNGRTTLEVGKEYQAALLGVEKLDEIWVLYWFDRNDSLEQRAILQVHPRGNPENPLRGVFATRAPVRPNLIALSRCRVISVQDNIIEIDYIDAFPDTPLLDIKP
jgi:tRNA-Thr(GGU) m(6)t(6)A37 methyltransferase TsaA